MIRNKIAPKQRKISPPVSQNSFNTQHNFMSIQELSSAYEGESHAPTITNIRRKYLMQNLINKLKFLIAPYIQPVTLKQNWNQSYKADEKNEEDDTERQNIISEIRYKYRFWHLMMIIEAISVVILFWASSTELVFLPKFADDIEQNIFSFDFKAGPCICIIIKLVLKQLLILRQRALLKKQRSSESTESEHENQKQSEDEQKQNSNHEDWFHNLKDIIRSIFYCSASFIYLFIHFIGLQWLRELVQTIIVVIFFVKVWNLKQNMEKIYSYVEAKDYKNQFRIIVLFFLVLGACHFMALALYGITYLYPDRNWINAVDKIAVKQNTWLSHYTCSIYFTITTMATVGYGDFTPVQTGQMFLVSFIQLFGTALFGYMINVVGLSVVEINKKNQEFDNHISTINKLQNHYQISRQLCQKFKDDIIKNQSVKKETPLSQNQEIQFFKMIQNSLKEQFILETNIKVIKKSIFFLTHFTVNFQNEIALKLIRKIYKKNQKVPLVQHDGEINDRCMFIINSGSLDIEIAHQSSNIVMKKFIKNISPQEGKPTLNVFGYSGLIMNRDIDLEATTKDTCVIYLLRRKDVLECMDKNMLDFQGIAELRERMLQYKSINHVEAPSMMDIEKHYVPNIFFVNKKKKIIVQERQPNHERGHRKCRIKVITLKNYQYRTMMCIDLDDSLSEQAYGMKFMQGNKTQNEDNQNSMKFEMEQKNDNIDDALITKLDQAKNYENFMKKSNINKIIPKYHSYLRGIRKQRKQQEHIQRMNLELNKYDKPRQLTYSEGMNRIAQQMSEQ